MLEYTVISNTCTVLALLKRGTIISRLRNARQLKKSITVQTVIIVNQVVSLQNILVHFFLSYLYNFCVALGGEIEQLST